MLACKKYNIIICVYVNMLTCIIWWGKYMNMIIMVICAAFLPSLHIFLIRNIFFGSIFFFDPYPPEHTMIYTGNPWPFWHLLAYNSYTTSWPGRLHHLTKKGCICNIPEASSLSRFNTIYHTFPRCGRTLPQHGVNTHTHKLHQNAPTRKGKKGSLYRTP